MKMAEAETILKKYTRQSFLLQHAQVVSGVMKQFAAIHDPSHEEFWAIVGLLHDIDFEIYPDQHCVKGEELLRENGVSEDIIRSAMSHGFGMTGTPHKPMHVMEKILFAVDELTGLIGAAALMRPSKSVQDMELSSVKKKFKDKQFAKGCSRDVIEQGAAMLGLELDDLLLQTLSAMKTFCD